MRGWWWRKISKHSLRKQHRPDKCLMHCIRSGSGSTVDFCKHNILHKKTSNSPIILNFRFSRWISWLMVFVIFRFPFSHVKFSFFYIFFKFLPWNHYMNLLLSFLMWNMPHTVLLPPWKRTEIKNLFSIFIAASWQTFAYNLCDSMEPIMNDFPSLSVCYDNVPVSHRQLLNDFYPRRT